MAMKTKMFEGCSEARGLRHACGLSPLKTLLCGVLTGCAMAAAAPGAVDHPIIVQVFYDATGPDNQLEWVELYNPTAASIDLSGYSLCNGGANYTFSRVQLTGMLGAYRYFLVGGPLSCTTNRNPVFDQAVDFNPDFQNGGADADGVALFRCPAVEVLPATVPIDAVIYGGVTNGSHLIDETGNPGAVDVVGAAAGGSIQRTTLEGERRVQANPDPTYSPWKAPTTPATITGMSLENGLLSLTITNLTMDLRQRVLRADRLNSGVWSTAGTFVAISTTTNWTEAISCSNAFYRVQSSE